MISERISDDIPPQMTKRNMVIPILISNVRFNIYTSNSGICLKQGNKCYFRIVLSTFDCPIIAVL